MASLDLGTLQVGVKVTGTDKAEQELNEVKNAVKDVDDTSSKSAKGMKALSGSFSEAFNKSKTFGSGMKGLSSAFSEGFDMSNIMAGAIGGLTAALVDMAGRAFQMAIQAIGEFIAKGVELASDLQEVKNVVDTTFEDGAEKIYEWSESADEAFGLSTLQAQEFSSTMGAMLKASGLASEQLQQMSIGVAQLSGDIASFRNLKPEEAFQKLGSIVSGEIEPLKSLGIVMSEVNLNAFLASQGIEKVWRELSEAEKITTRYNFILQATADAQGDFSKTQDSYANTSRVLETSIDNVATIVGDVFLPTITRIKQAFADFVNENQELVKFLSLVGRLLLELGTLIVESVLAGLESVGKLLNGVLKLINPILEKTLDSYDDFRKSLANKTNESSDDINYEFIEMGDSIVDTMGKTKDGSLEAIEGIAEGTSNELDKVKGVFDKFYDNELKEYEKKMQERYGNSLNGQLKVAEKVAQEEERLLKERERQEEAYTLKLEQEAKKRKKIQENWMQQSGASNSTNIPRFANGTASAPGGWSVVGETGRELMYVPPKAQIFTNSQTERMIGGGTTITGNTFIVQANNYQEFIDSMEQAVISGEW